MMWNLSAEQKGFSRQIKFFPPRHSLHIIPTLILAAHIRHARTDPYRHRQFSLMAFILSENHLVNPTPHSMQHKYIL